MVGAIASRVSGLRQRRAVGGYGFRYQGRDFNTFGVGFVLT